MKLACFADCHIGSYGKKLDPETGLNARLLDHINTLDWIVADACWRGCEQLLCAGDMFRNCRPTPTELVFTQRALSGRGLDAIAIPGNHDLPRAIGEKSALDALHCVRVVSTPQVLDLGDYQIAILPYPNRAMFAALEQHYGTLTPEDVDCLMTERLTRILQGLAAETDPSRPSVLLAHISIDCAELGAERGIMAGRDVTIPIGAIPEVFTFAVFGHIHRNQSFEAHGRPNVLYTGSTERIDFGEEGEQKSYVILDIERRSWERVPIPCRDYRTIDVNWSDGEFHTAPDPDTADTICRIRITRPESAKPDYARLETLAEGCWDFRGFVEDVTRTTTVRSSEVVRAQTLGELITLWHQQSGCEQPLDWLVSAGEELERSVAR